MSIFSNTAYDGIAISFCALSVQATDVPVVDDQSHSRDVFYDAGLNQAYASSDDGATYFSFRYYTFVCVPAFLEDYQLTYSTQTTTP